MKEFENSYFILSDTNTFIKTEYVEFHYRADTKRMSDLPAADRGEVFSFSFTSRPAPRPSEDTVALSPGLKRPEREADRSHPSRAGVNMLLRCCPHTPSWRYA
jgi:hypothetical protein